MKTLAGQTRPITTRGFTLIEVLVALIITAIGLLGVAKMQSLAYASTGTASVRSLITVQAASLAATMRANRSYWAFSGPSAWAGATPNTLVITNNAGAVKIDDATLDATGAAATFASNACASGAGAPCVPATLAGNDLHIWARGLFDLLPNINPTTVISCPTGSTPISCTITISWTEKTVAINAQGVADPNTAISAPSYVLYVEP